MSVSFDRPVVILGAPRSGTTLLFNIVRGIPGFHSLAKESDIVWEPHIHPRRNGWRKEGIADERITKSRVAAIRRRFRAYALPASVWGGIGRERINGYRRNPFRALLLRAGYRGLAHGRMFWPFSEPVRLAEKTIGSEFYLDLVDAVFPGARFIYIQRHPYPCINSMISGWLEPHRFFRFRVPGGLNIRGYQGNRWNFVLPPGWEDYRAAPLEQVVAFQWAATHRQIMNEIEGGLLRDRTLTVRLEDLSRSPEPELERIAEFVDAPWCGYLTGLAGALPKVNANPAGVADSFDNLAHWDRIRNIRSVIEPLAGSMGYSS